MANVSPCKHPIDWEMLYKAENFYRREFGSTYLETPWIVEPKVAGITAPTDEIKSSLGQLVGSAEQGFLQLLSDKDPKMEMGKYYHSISPCFRDDVVDELHERHFMKLELIWTIPPTGYTGKYSVLEDILNASMLFFSKIGGIGARIVEMGDTYDIVGYKSGIELGSYGIRQYDDINWVYGTGLALPRFSQVRDAEDKL